MHSMRKMLKIIKESNESKIDYLQYLDFYKSLDKDLLNCLVMPLATTHK